MPLGKSMIRLTEKLQQRSHPGRGFGPSVTAPDKPPSHTKRLVWGAYDGGTLLGTFRLDDDGALLTVTDDAFAPVGGQVGVVHPVELDDAVRAAWGEQLADYEILQPFEQLGRAVFRAGASEVADLLRRADGATIQAGSLFRLTNAGWRRGPVVDNGYWHDASIQGSGFTLRVEAEHGVNISGGFGADQETTVTLFSEVGTAPAPLPFSEALLALERFLA